MCRVPTTCVRAHIQLQPPLQPTFHKFLQQYAIPVRVRWTASVRKGWERCNFASTAQTSWLETGGQNPVHGTAIVPHCRLQSAMYDKCMRKMPWVDHPIVLINRSGCEVGVEISFQSLLRRLAFATECWPRLGFHCYLGSQPIFTN